MIIRIMKFFLVMFAFIITLSILYWIGTEFNIPILVFHQRNNEYSTGSLLPYIVAGTVSIFVERMIVKRFSS
ncbi:MAG: hypothetical protein Q8935_21630 [Bacillota bacterium]|nr:hypothetical protein [Bacillota bacterium]